MGRSRHRRADDDFRDDNAGEAGSEWTKLSEALAAAHRSETRRPNCVADVGDASGGREGEDDNNSDDDDGDDGYYFDAKGGEISDASDDESSHQQGASQGYEIVIPDGSSGDDDDGDDGDVAVVVPSGDHGRSAHSAKGKQNHRRRSSTRKDFDQVPNARVAKQVLSRQNKDGNEDTEELQAPKHTPATVAETTTSTTMTTKKNDKGYEQLPPGHVYALRKIINAADDEGEEEEERKESAPAVSALGRRCPPPRVITSCVVRASERVYRQLEDGTAGTVLCPASGVGDRLGGDRFHAAEVGARQSRESLAIAAVGARSIRGQMEGGHRGPTRTNCPVMPRNGEGRERRGKHGDDDEAVAGTAGPSSSPSEPAAERKKKKKPWRRAVSGGRRLYGSMKQRLGLRRQRRKGQADGGPNNAKDKGPIAKNKKKPVGNNGRGGDEGDEAVPPRARSKSSRTKAKTTAAALDWDDSDLDDRRVASRTPSFIDPPPNATSRDNGGGGGGRRIKASTAARLVGGSSLGATIFGDEAVIRNRITPIDEVVCVDRSLGIYVSESGLSALDCRDVVRASESCASARGGWSSYTYAKQTLGCRENDRLALASARPVLTACATIRRHLAGGDGGGVDDGGRALRPDGKELVLDVREPHVVKYDTSRSERQKLDMHTDKSEWTFLIALSEGRGQDYGGGGTYFQALNSTVHLQRGQMLIFRGKLRHCGVRIANGSRYLLVGFLVPQAKAASKGGGGGGVAI